MINIKIWLLPFWEYANYNANEVVMKIKILIFKIKSPEQIPHPGILKHLKTPFRSHNMCYIQPR